MSKWPKLLASVAFLAPPLGWRAARRYRRIENLPSRSSRCLPSLSIIVPARDEASNLHRLLSSLCVLDYDGGLEIIVVDDQSTDQTAAVARSYGVRVISLKSLPPDWRGKPHACHVGADAANGVWLLFTDADTIHLPKGPAGAVSYALDHDLDGLSAFLRHEFRGLLDHLVLQIAFVGLFASLPDIHAVLNGQYILLRRDVYFASSGFASVRSDPLEDLALGNHLHNLGYRVPMLRGDSLAQVAMYHDRSHLWRGITRIGAGFLRWSGANSLVVASFITAIVTPLVVLTLSICKLLKFRWVVATWGSVTAGLWPWSQSFGSPWRLLLAPTGGSFVLLAASWGLISRILRRGVRWKGRVV